MPCQGKLLCWRDVNPVLLSPSSGGMPPIPCYCQNMRFAVARGWGDGEGEEGGRDPCHQTQTWGAVNKAAEHAGQGDGA